ncbi:MAG: hypothetical protein KDD53_08375, partial [Bdellovibrionales bacterium]|nr:hypothetical protein [Bdellovibrionales bacterium]
ESGDTATHYVSKIVLLTGLGKDQIGFRSPNQETLAALDYNRSLSVHEKFYFTYQELLSAVGGEPGSFPRELFSGKDVVIQGGGHSALTVIELISGLFSGGDDFSVASLRGPRSITVVGAKEETGLEFQAKEYSRYAAAAQLFPRDNDDIGALITPIANNYVYQMKREDDGSIAVFCGPKGLNKDTPTEELSKLRANVLISTVGFKPEAEQILDRKGFVGFTVCTNEAQREGGEKELRCSQFEMRFQALEATNISGCRFVDEHDRSYLIRFLEENKWVCTECDSTGAEVESSRIELDQDGIHRLIQSERPPRQIIYPAWNGKAATLPPVICATTGNIIGRYGFNRSIIIGGPASSPRLEDDDLERVRKFGTPENQVSISLTSIDTQRLASSIFSEIGNEKSSVILTPNRSLTPPIVPFEKISPSVPVERLLQFGLLRASSEYEAPEINESAIITLQRGQLSGEYRTYSTRRLNELEQRFLAEILTDPVIAKVLDSGFESISFPLSRNEIKRSLKRLAI